MTSTDADNRDERPAGKISVTTQDGLRVLHLAGEIDADTVTAFENDRASPVDAECRPAEVIAVVDTSAATFISAEGLGFLVRQTEPMRALGARPVLRRPPRPVRRVLWVAGLNHLFDEQA